MGLGESKVANYSIYKGNEFCNYKSLAPSTSKERLYFNYQGVNSLNIVMSFNNHAEFWGTDNLNNWVPNTESTNTYYQQWPQQGQLFLQSTNETPVFNQNNENFVPHTDLQTGVYQDWRQNAYSSYLTPTGINPTQNLYQPQVLQQHTMKSDSNSTSRFSVAARSHHARISLVPTSTGNFKTIVKRKRKRTMFRTEQIEALEAVFAKKPYISREDRQILADQLKVNDNVIKVWFQNRRIREKKENEEMLSTTTSEESSNSYNSAHLDYLESKICQNTNESGYVTLDDIAMGEIVNVIDTVLKNSADLENTQCDLQSNHTEKVKPERRLVTLILDSDIPLSTPVEESSNELEETAVESEGSTYAGSIYEPISPAMSEKTEEEEPRWKPFAADKSLQRLFDLHFC